MTTGPAQLVTPAVPPRSTLHRAVPARGEPGVSPRRLLELGRPHHRRHGEVLLQADEPVDQIHLVRTGEVRLKLRQADVGPATVAVVRAGGVVGDVPLFAGHPMAFDAVVEEDGVMFAIETRDFLALIQREPSLSLQWLRGVACRLEQIQRHVLMLVTKDLRGQVATLLLTAQEEQPDGTTNVTLSHRELAELVGAKRPSVSRVLTDFREQGLVRTGYGHIELLDPVALGDIAGTPPGAPPCDPRRPPS